MKLGPIILVLGIAACDAGVQAPQAPQIPSTPPPKPPPGPPPPIENTAPPAPHPHEVIATLERTACYGTCPIYTFTVYRDGVVEYNGDAYVKLRGKAIGHIALAQIDAIDKLFSDNGYTKLSDKYVQYDVTDNPSANTSYRSLDGHVKHIAHYYGDSHSPAVLETIEDGLDKLVGIDQWIGTPAEREAKAGTWHR